MRTRRSWLEEQQIKRLEAGVTLRYRVCKRCECCAAPAVIGFANCQAGRCAYHLGIHTSYKWAKAWSHAPLPNRVLK